jgi:hypothetical protein
MTFPAMLAILTAPLLHFWSVLMIANLAWACACISTWKCVSAATVWQSRSAWRSDDRRARRRYFKQQILESEMQPSRFRTTFLEQSTDLGKLLVPSVSKFENDIIPGRQQD